MKFVGEFQHFKTYRDPQDENKREQIGKDKADGLGICKKKVRY